MTPPTPTGAPDGGVPRIVMFLNADPTNDSRVLREARALADAGYALTLVARTRPGDPDAVVRTTIAGVEAVLVPLPVAWRRTWTLIRTPWRRWPEDARALLRGLRRPGERAAAVGLVLRRVAALPLTVALLPLSLPALLLPATSSNRDIVDWLLRWRFGTLAWNRAATSVAPRAAVCHGHDLTALPAAAATAARDGARLVYDSHEIFLESGANARRPRWARAGLARFERRLAARADALVTVNRTLARLLGPRLRIDRITVVHNCPARWTPPATRTERIRAATGIAAHEPVLLYHGAFLAQRGLRALADAILAPGLERAHAVYLGFGPLADELRELARDPRFAGRLHVLPGVPPDELPAWVASADVGVMVNQPLSANEWHSTPNKLFECLAAGVPVVSSDFPERRAVVLEDPDGPLGAVCDPTDPAAIAQAIRRLVELPPGEQAALRARCLRAAHERWNWETEAARLVELYRDLVPPPG